LAGSHIFLNRKAFKMDSEELKEVLEKHKKFLRGEAGVERAHLRSANLSFANLSFADLRFADLRFADLSFANLRSANLRSADLSSANLRFADLSFANLSSANLRSANLSFAVTDKRYIVLSCIGSRKDSTTYCFDDDKIWCGCFTGTLDDFEQAVLETHADNSVWLKEYTGAIAYIRSLKS
jgi:hypothetical protein